MRADYVKILLQEKHAFMTFYSTTDNGFHIERPIPIVVYLPNKCPKPF